MPEPFDTSVVLRAIARAHGPEHVKAIIGGDPRKQALADHLFAVVAEAPPLTAEQRAGIRAIFRSSATPPVMTGGGPIAPA
jgi:hypothetical protein